MNIVNGSIHLHYQNYKTVDTTFLILFLCSIKSTFEIIILLLWKTWFWSHFGSSITQINVCLIKKRIKNMKCRKYPYNYKHLSHQSLIKAIIVRERDILMKFVCRYMHSNHENFNRFVFVFVYFAFTHFIIIILCTRMTFLL